MGRSAARLDPAKKYPTLLFCEGGPQSVVSQAWSYRWNFALMASQGYVVVAPNRRGVPSFGQEWLEQISGDYSGQNIRDYLSAIDDVAREPWCDRDRLGCVGASYGGYSVYFLAGCHQKRFKAFIAHCGIFNFESMYGQTEELFFINHDYGGAYWEKDNPTAMRSYANSPHKFVDRWDTPILIVTGEYDFRIPYTQSLEAFTAARLHGIPARLVAFEDEAHQVFKPQELGGLEPRILRLARQIRQGGPVASSDEPRIGSAPLRTGMRSRCRFTITPTCHDEKRGVR